MSYVLHYSQNTNQSVGVNEIVDFIREPEIEGYCQFEDITTRGIREQYSENHNTKAPFSVR